MHEESPKRALRVGATGYAGHQLARYLLTSTDVTVILSSRNRSKLGDLQSSLPAVDCAGCRFVIQAGFHPGILAALVRHAAQQLDTIHSAIVGSVIRDEGGVPFTSGATELVESPIR